MFSLRAQRDLKRSSPATRSGRGDRGGGGGGGGLLPRLELPHANVEEVERLLFSRSLARNAVPGSGPDAAGQKTSMFLSILLVLLF